MSVTAVEGALILRDGVPTWRYDVRPFQRAFLRSGLTCGELERLCGLSNGRAGRLLGLRPKSGAPLAKTLSYGNAVRLARALHLDLVELGL